MTEILNTFGIDVRLLVIQAINFAIVLVVLWYFLYRPLVRLLDSRNKKIQESVEKAEVVDKAHDSLKQERQEVLSMANAEAEGIVERGKNAARDEASEIIKSTHHKSEQILSDAQARAQAERESIIKESEREVTRLAILAAEKVLREKAGS